MNPNQEKQNPLPPVAALTPLACSPPLVWNAGPARGGGGTAQGEIPEGHERCAWWADGELLLVIVETDGGPELSLVRVSADGDQLGFYDPVTGDDNFGWMDTDIEWWARVMESLPQNHKDQPPEARPCPHCGGSAGLRYYTHDPRRCYYACDDSRCHHTYLDPREALESWNRRANLPLTHGGPANE